MKAEDFRMLMSFVAPYRRLYGGILSVIFLVSLLESVNLAAFFPVLLLLLAENGASSSTGVLGAMVRAVERIPLGDPLLAAVLFLAAVTLLKSLLMLIEARMLAHASGTLQHDLNVRLMSTYASADPVHFLESRQGDLLYNLSSATARVGALAQKIPRMIAEALKAAAIGGLLLAAWPAAAGLLAAAGWGYHQVTRGLSEKISYHTGKGRVKAGAAQSAVAAEFLLGIRQILSFGAQGHWLRRFAENSRAYRDLFIRDFIWLSVPRILLEMSAVLGFAGLLLTLRLLKPELLASQLPLIGVFLLGTLRLLPSLTFMGQLRMEVAGLAGDAQVLHRVFEETLARDEGGSLPPAPLARAIVLEGVEFAYPGRPSLFRDLHVSFEKGKMTAVVGPSGSGKTTLIHLVLGFLRPRKGQIRLDETDLWQFHLPAWRSRIGFVSQEGFVFHASVRENILFGREGFSEGDLRRAAEAATALAFIEALPMGFETVLGEQGMKLSGGQRQRIAIARAILHDPEVLIFDEATSALDAESERLVQEAIERTRQNRTVIVIAHRLTTVSRADRLVVLDQGRVVEQGSPEDLLRTGGRYAQMAACDV